MTELDVSNNQIHVPEQQYQNRLESKVMRYFFRLKSTLYALCIETERNFVNQYKGKINVIIFSWDRVSSAMSLRSDSFQLKTVANKKGKIR